MNVVAVFTDEASASVSDTSAQNVPAVSPFERGFVETQQEMAEGKVKKKTAKISHMQLEALLCFFEENRSLVSGGSYKPGETKQSRDAKWQKLDVIMREYGESRTTASWKKCWLDVRKGFRHAMIKLRQTVNVSGGTVGLEAMKLRMTPSQKRIHALLGDDSIVVPGTCKPHNAKESVDGDTRGSSESETSDSFLSSETVEVLMTPPICYEVVDLVENEFVEGNDVSMEPPDEQHRNEHIEDKLATKHRHPRKRKLSEMSTSSEERERRRPRDVNMENMLRLMTEQRDATAKAYNDIATAINANTAVLEKILKVYCKVHNVITPEC